MMSGWVIGLGKEGHMGVMIKGLFFMLLGVLFDRLVTALQGAIGWIKE